MGGIETNTKYEPNSVELIQGYRSGSGSSGERAKNTCDIRVTAFDPFDFKVDWRTKYVKYRKLYTSKSGRKYYRTVRDFIPYPYYTFVKKTRSVKEWRLEIIAGQSVLGQIPGHLKSPHINRVLGWLVDRMKKYGPCRPMKPKSANIQHDAYHFSSSIVPGIVPEGYSDLLPTGFRVPLATNGQYGYRAFELEQGYVGDTGIGPNWSWNTSLKNDLIDGPQGIAFSDSTVSTVTAMLWPSSGDFEDIGVTPLVDLAEAASDGVFPLGPPPDPVEAHKRMVKNCMDDKMFAYLTDTVDFAANAYLWTTLVLEPVIQSAIGLAASVEANDQAIDAFTSKAQSNKWHQGKSLRIFGKRPKDAAVCLGAPEKLVHNVVNTGHLGTLTHTFDYKKCEVNASIVYKLNEFDAVLMNTSGQRLGQFFNRMSVSLDTVLHNVLPLSFVYDWFSSEYTGVLNLKDKVYMPVADWKVTMSYNLEMGIESEGITTALYYAIDYYVVSKATGQMWFQGTLYGPNHLDNLEDHTEMYSTFYYLFTNKQNLSPEVARTVTVETHNVYRRVVFYQPVRRVDFSSGEVEIQCFDFIKPDPIDDTGKLVTIGALIWGLLPG